jgi:hypothetical protein
MRAISFTQGAIAAAFLALAGAVLVTSLTLFWPVALVLRLLIAALGAAYVALLVARSTLRSGRIVLPLAWLLAAAAIALWAPSLAAFIVLHTALIWLARSVLCHASVLSALLDLALSVTALVVAFASLRHSGSWALSVWSFFLVQALFAFIPRSWQRATSALETSAAARFDHAYSAAESALQRLHRP